MSWIRVTAAGSVPLREGRSVTLGQSEIALFNLGDRFLAIENRCPHNGGPLADGIVSGNTVVCPLHAWKTCLETGEVKKPSEQKVCVRTYPAKVEGGIVFVQIPHRREVAA